MSCGPVTQIRSFGKNRKRGAIPPWSIFEDRFDIYIVIVVYLKACHMGV